MCLIKTARKLDLLILDELGYAPASKLLFDVISAAYERFSLIVTTNLSFENWTEVLGRERLTGPHSTDSPIAAMSWKPPEKVTGYRMPNDGPQKAQARNRY